MTDEVSEVIVSHFSWQCGSPPE